MARILIADDEVDLVEVLSGIIRDEGHEVRTVLDGTQALSVIHDWRPDVAILDLDMPGLSGPAVASDVAAHRADLPTGLVLLSGNANVHRIGAELGIPDCVTKPMPNREDTRGAVRGDAPHAAPACDVLLREVPLDHDPLLGAAPPRYVPRASLPPPEDPSMRTLALSILLAATAACGGASPPPAAAPAAKTLFTDAPPYASVPAVATSAASAHAAKGAPAPGVKTPCLTCHKAGGTATPFAFGGTVFTDDKMTKGTPDVEIRVVAANGKATSARTDADGNFWAAGDPIALPAHAGARIEPKTVLMGSVVDKADCNGCHDATFPITFRPPQ